MIHLWWWLYLASRPIVINTTISPRYEALLVVQHFDKPVFGMTTVRGTLVLDFYATPKSEWFCKPIGDFGPTIQAVCGDDAGNSVLLTIRPAALSENRRK